MVWWAWIYTTWVTLAGPIVYLLGELLFRQRMIGSLSSKRLVAIAGLAALGLVASHIPALGLGLLLTAILIGLGIWEYEAVSVEG